MNTKVTTPTANLVPGSVWQRPTKGGGSATSLVLCVTNLPLRDELLESNPHQVVFVNESEDILSMTIDRFLSKRTFVGMNNTAGTKFGELLSSVFTQEEPEETEDGGVDIGATVIEESLFPVEQAKDEEAVLEEDSNEDEDDVPYSNGLALNIGPHPLKSVLESSLISYSESPFHTGDTLHALQFVLAQGGEEGVTLAQIEEAFTSEDPNSVQKFELTTTTGTFQVEIDGFLSVMLSSNGAYDTGTLYITSAGDFRASLKHPHTEEQPQVDTQQPAPQTPQNLQQVNRSEQVHVHQHIKSAPQQVAPVVTIS